jgi:hypothetical protein
MYTIKVKREMKEYHQKLMNNSIPSEVILQKKAIRKLIFLQIRG